MCIERIEGIVCIERIEGIVCIERIEGIERMSIKTFRAYIQHIHSAVYKAYTVVLL